MAKLSLDHTSDYSHRELRSFLKVASQLPDYVVDCDLDFEEDHQLKNLPKTAFADEINKSFPCNTEARTYLSYSYFLNKKASLEKQFKSGYVKQVENKLLKSAELFGIDKDLRKYAEDYNKAHVVVEKVATPLFSKNVDGVQIDIMFVKSAADLRAAADQFCSSINNIPFEWREEICRNIVKKSDEYNVEELPEIVFKYAGEFFTDSNHVRGELTRRSGFMKNEQHKKAYDQLIEVSEVDDIKDVLKIAEVCYELEKMDGAYEKTAARRLLGDPVDKLFYITAEKVASIIDGITVQDEFYKFKDLSKVDPEIYKQAFGVGIDPSDRDNLQEILPTMPRSDMTLFRELSGIRPV